ncbi:hypothetical protein [Streptomyces sp. NPDC086519]|uniref:hypothetical protein n=1 Tax=Streptomyces sp. NPDC086519 TaxID=3154863 RepID=UPI003414D1D3
MIPRLTADTRKAPRPAPAGCDRRLIAARVLPGSGTSAACPAASAVRTPAERTGQDSPAGVPTALAVSARTVAVIGPTPGGMPVGAGGRPLVFTVDVPLSAACPVLGVKWLPATAGRARCRGTDLAGTAAITLPDRSPARLTLPSRQTLRKA